MRRVGKRRGLSSSIPPGAVVPSLCQDTGVANSWLACRRRGHEERLPPPTPTPKKYALGSSPGRRASGSAPPASLLSQTVTRRPPPTWPETAVRAAAGSVSRAEPAAGWASGRRWSGGMCRGRGEKSHSETRAKRLKKQPLSPCARRRLCPRAPPRARHPRPSGPRPPHRSPAHTPHLGGALSSTSARRSPRRESRGPWVSTHQHPSPLFFVSRGPRR